MAKKTKTFLAVERILSQNLASPTSGVPPRDSDQELLIQFMQFELGMNMTIEQLQAMRSFSMESVTRARRKLQENGQYLPSPEVAKKRRLKAYELQQVAPTETAGGLQRRIEEN